MRYLFFAIAAFAISLPAAAEVIAITGGKVHTVGPQGTIENATVLIVDGKVAAVGANVAIPDGATRVNAAQKIITPGLVSPTGRLGLVEVGNSAGPVDSTQLSEQFTAGFDVVSAYNPASTLIAVSRTEGVTSAAIVPSPGAADDFGNQGHVLAGQASVVSLGDGEWLLRPRAAMVVSLGENGSAMSGGSRAGAFLILKNALDEAVDYGQHKSDVERGMRRTYQHSVTDLEALQPVIAGQTPLLVAADRASDIRAALALLQSYGVRMILSGGAEAWLLAEELAAANVPVLVTVTNNLPGNFDRINIRRGSAKILAEAGVKVILTDGESESHNARNITQSAGNAVADGLSWDGALRAITLSPAEAWGVADVVGSIEVGKQADLVIWPADPFELTTYPDQVYIRGAAIPMHSRQTLLRDRYLQENDLPPAYRH